MHTQLSLRCLLFSRRHFPLLWRGSWIRGAPTKDERQSHKASPLAAQNDKRNSQLRRQLRNWELEMCWLAKGTTPYGHTHIISKTSRKNICTPIPFFSFLVFSISLFGFVRFFFSPSSFPLLFFSSLFFSLPLSSFQFISSFNFPIQEEAFLPIMFISVSLHPPCPFTCGARRNRRQEPRQAIRWWHAPSSLVGELARNPEPEPLSTTPKTIHVYETHKRTRSDEPATCCGDPIYHPPIIYEYCFLSISEVLFDTSFYWLILSTSETLLKTYCTLTSTHITHTRGTKVTLTHFNIHVLKIKT